MPQPDEDEGEPAEIGGLLFWLLVLFVSVFLLFKVRRAHRQVRGSLG